MKITIPLVTLVYLLCGCMHVGQHLHYPSSTPLELGNIRNADYLTMFGKPFSVEVKETTDGKFEMVHYQYVVRNNWTGSQWNQVLDLEFRDGVLNAYFFSSNFEKEQTVINIKNLENVHRGISKKSDVLAILGKPNGMAYCPNYVPVFKELCDSGAEIWGWLVIGDQQVSPDLQIVGEKVEKRIYITFDKKGFVRNVESSQKEKL